MTTALENQIASMERRIAVQDDRIGRLMSQRADMEKKLAALLEKQAQQGVAK